MVPFNENKLLDHFINSISVVNQIDKNDLWTKLIYYIDSQRRHYNDDNEEDLSLWKYFSTNFNLIDSWCKTVEISSILCESIKTIYAKRFDSRYKYVSKIGIISPNGINVTKEILNKILSLNSYKYEFKYDGTPHYFFETSSEDTSSKDHEKFVEDLKTHSDIFIKVDYLAKEIKL